ncbi:hypothetical protein ACFPRL_14755 [Pseudoclavibacter helvolus]
MNADSLLSRKPSRGSRRNCTACSARETNAPSTSGRCSPRSRRSACGPRTRTASTR